MSLFFKSILAATFFFLIISTDLLAATDTTKVTSFAGKKLKSEKFYLNGSLVKEVRYDYKKEIYFQITNAHPDNKLKVEEIKVLYNDGKLWATGTRVEGKMEGLSKGFHKNGVICCIVNYRRGKIDSIKITFHENGKPFERTRYKDGKLLEVLDLFDKDGKLLDKGTISQGNGTHNVYNEEGKLEEIDSYEEGKLKKKLKL